MENASDGGLVLAGLVLRTLILKLSPLMFVGRANSNSKSKVPFLSLTLASSVGEEKYPSLSDNSRINSLLLSTMGGSQVKFTKYSLKPADAQTAVQAEFPARLGLSAGTGLLRI